MSNRVVPGYAFHGLALAALVALCAVGILPSEQFVDLMKWVLVVCAAAVLPVSLASAIWPRPDPEPIPGISPEQWKAMYPSPEMGVGMPLSSGIFEEDVFSQTMGQDMPDNYTSLVRDADAPPGTTDRSDGIAVGIPVDGPCPVDSRPWPPIGQEFDVEHLETTQPIVILGNPQETKRP